MTDADLVDAVPCVGKFLVAIRLLQALQQKYPAAADEIGEAAQVLAEAVNDATALVKQMGDHFRAAQQPSRAAAAEVPGCQMVVAAAWSSDDLMGRHQSDHSPVCGCYHPVGPRC